MSNNLLVIPLEFKDKIEEKEQSVIKKTIKEYEEFYIEKDSLEKFKVYIQKNLPKTVAFFKSNITTDSDFVRALKSLNQETKIILIDPQISNLKLYINKEKELYDEVYQLLENSSAIEVSNCRIADLLVVPSNEDKELLSKKISEKFINTYDEVLENNIEFAQKNKYLVSIIMLTYNQLEDTKICVESLFKHTTDVNYELIFVDNGSTKDDTKTYLETLQKEHKNIKTIFNEEKIESIFNKTDYREKKDNKKKKNEIIELHEMIKKSEENNVKIQEMIKKSEENNLKFQKMILESNRKSEENNLKFQKMLLESNRKSEENNLKFQEMIKKSEENNLKFQEIQEKVLELHKTIIESNKKSEEKNLKQFKKYDKKISELHDKLNLITNENKENEKKIKSVSYNSEKKKISLPSLNSNS